jgi:hypothetical protein
MTIQQLINLCRKAFQNLEVAYVHPSLYLLCVSDEFTDFDDQARERVFYKKTNAVREEVETLTAAAIVSLYFVTSAERATRFGFIDKSPHSQHWLPLLDKGAEALLSPAISGPIPAIHFYGFKGGQARTTVLAMLAKTLAEDGYRVLVVDADIEAPSLDFLFETGVPSVDSTLMGISGWSENFNPIPAFASASTNGLIDIIPCRPRDDDYDMDFAAFSLRVSLDIGTLRKGVEKLKNYVIDADNVPKYDIVMFDHRTGIASSVLPIVRSWRGPSVISVRPDGLSTQALGAFNTLFAQNPETPGAYVCYSVDQDDTRAEVLSRNSDTVFQLLDAIADALVRGAEDSDLLSPTELQRYWIGWYFDKEFVTKVSPELQKLNRENQNSIRQLREVLSLSGRKKSPPPSIVFDDHRAPSGATASGWFIETNDIARLFSTSSRVNYISGRKGTGKSRLFREMIDRSIAEPLFTAADYEGGGLKSLSSDYEYLLNACEGNFKQFWWALLYISLCTSNTTDSAAFETELKRYGCLDVEDRKNLAQSFNVAELASSKKLDRIFLIDGIETAVPAAKLRLFIEELLLFMLALQSDSKLRPFIQARLFLRTDLLDTASQNVEQQTSQRVVELRWDSDSIFNYVLARIERISWFNDNFHDACELIRENMNLIRTGKLSSQKYEEILLEIFPERLRRNNLQTLTFLETYFSDSSGKVDMGTSFYPRLFEAFLVEVATMAIKLGEKGEPAIENGRVLHTIVLDAHSKASIQFVNEVKQELYVLLELSNDDNENRQMVDALIAAFEGRPTPFLQDALIESFVDKIKGTDAPRLRNALTKMTEIGIFERHPKNAGELRAGRLYKSALRMKYIRGAKP